MNLHLTRMVAKTRGWGEVTLAKVSNLRKVERCHALPRRLSALGRPSLAGSGASLMTWKYLLGIKQRAGLAAWQSEEWLTVGLPRAIRLPEGGSSSDTGTLLVEASSPLVANQLNNYFNMTIKRAIVTTNASIHGVPVAAVDFVPGLQQP